MPRTELNRRRQRLVGLMGDSTVVRVSATTNAVVNRVTVDDNVHSIAAKDNLDRAVHHWRTDEVTRIAC